MKAPAVIPAFVFLIFGACVLSMATMSKPLRPAPPVEITPAPARAHR